jgi:hypothetical protein
MSNVLEKCHREIRRTVEHVTINLVTSRALMYPIGSHLVYLGCVTVPSNQRNGTSPPGCCSAGPSFCANVFYPDFNFDGEEATRNCELIRRLQRPSMVGYRVYVMFLRRSDRPGR